MVEQDLIGDQDNNKRRNIWKDKTAFAVAGVAVDDFHDASDAAAGGPLYQYIRTKGPWVSHCAYFNSRLFLVNRIS